MSAYVEGLDEDTQNDDLEREFSRFGNLTKVFVARNHPGFALIHFQNDKDAREAIKEMNGTIINRSKIRVTASCDRSMRDRKQIRQDHSFDNSFRCRECPRYSTSSISQSSHTAWKSVQALDYSESVSVNKDSTICETSGNKRKLCGKENVPSGSIQKKKACVEESEDTLNINSLPVEILLSIFHYSKQYELANIARVCKWWHKIASCPVLWQKINLKMPEKSESQKKVVSEILPMYVTHLKLDFQNEFQPKEFQELEEFCVRLGKRCPSLKVLVLRFKKICITLQSAIDLCIQNMQNLEILSFHWCHFAPSSLKIEYGGQCKIKVLDLSRNYGFDIYNDLMLSKMPCLKKLILYGNEINNSWFKNGTSFLHNLEVLNLRFTDIHSSTFQILEKHALKVTELCLCCTYMQDHEFRFSNSGFPQLKTFCIKFCPDITCDTLISLVSSHQCLENIVVSDEMAESYAQHPFIVANECKLNLLKNSEYCLYYQNDYVC